MAFILHPALSRYLLSAPRSSSQMPSWASDPAPPSPSPLFFLTLPTTWHHRKLTSPPIVWFTVAASA